MPPKKNKQKGSPLRDGDTSGNLGKPPDNPGPAQEPQLCRESAPSQPTWSRHHKNDDNTSNTQLALDEEPKSSRIELEGHENAQDDPTDSDSTASRTSKASHSTTPAKWHTKSYATWIPEPQLRMNSSDVDRIVMAISSLNFTINEAGKSDQKSRENEWRTCESKLKILKELHDSNKTQAAEACKRKEAILNGIKEMGTNIMKVINPEITAMSSHTDVLNQAVLDTIMKQLHVISHTKETPKSPNTNYSTTTSKDPQSSQPKTKTPLPKKDESPEDRELPKRSPAMPSPPKQKGPKQPSFPPPRPSGGLPYRPDPGGSSRGGGGCGSGWQPPNNDDPDESPDPDNLPGVEDNTYPEREGESPPVNLPSTHTGYNWRSTHPGGTEIPHMGECWVNLGLKSATIHSETE